MSPLRTRSLNFKISGLVVLTSSLALLLATSGFLGYELVDYRKSVTLELTALAEILGASNTAALSFGDHGAATESLNALGADKRVQEAALFDKSGRIFARYSRHDSVTGIPLYPRSPGIYFGSGSVVLEQSIMFDRERIGTVFLRRSTAEVSARTWRYSGILALVLLISLGSSLLFSSRLQRGITRPIAGLVHVARRISADKDYSVRATKEADDEVGLLIDSFNEMLAQIEIYASARRIAEEGLRESEERYALAVRGAKDGLWDWKLNTNEVYYSPRWKRMLGYAEEEIGSVPEDWLTRIHPNDRGRVNQEIRAHLLGKTAEFSSEHRMRHRNGSYVWMLSRGIAVRNMENVAVRMAGSQTDITEGKVADPLTGLPNRLFFLEKLEAALEASVRIHDFRFAVLFLDLDRFKLVNDSLGHSAGDELLVGIAGRLQVCVRSTDVISRSTQTVTIARLGGDEFAILIAGMRQEGDAILVADRILTELKSPFLIQGQHMFAGISIGVAYGASGRTPEDILRNADTAMYYAKSCGKARFAVFDTLMREQAIARMLIEADLRKAIELNQFRVQYQAKVRLDDGAVAGFEALVRWDHPERGLISPTEFIPVAEDTELIVPLGYLVMKIACRQAADWNLRFTRPISVSVNISFKQLSQIDLVEKIKKLLADSGLAPGLLKIELTESSLMQDADSAVATLLQFKEMGIGLEIDDFGTGYSSLSYLHRLPFDTLKIDRSFVKGLGSDGESAEIVSTIIKLARSLEMNVVAEGIETFGQLAILRSLGCSHGQGYYFSKPLNADEIETFLVENETSSRVPFYKIATSELLGVA